jgi:hypothetical protein
MHYWTKIVNCDFGFIFCRAQKAPENHAFAWRPTEKIPSNWIHNECNRNRRELSLIETVFGF